jgi:hypothetical protein
MAIKRRRTGVFAELLLGVLGHPAGRKLQSKPINWRRTGVFVGGLLLGLAGTAALLSQFGEDASRAGKPAPDPTAATPAPVPVAAAAAPCDSYGAIVASAGDGDGQVALNKDVQGSASAVHNFIVKGKEAAASGHMRDAETTFLMACRSAERLQNDPVPLADAQYQLGRHYAQVAGAPGAARRGEMLTRAEALYANALQAYRQHRGAEHEKTRFAGEGLAQVQQLAAAAGLPRVAAAPAAPQPAPRGDANDTRIAGNMAQPRVAPPPVVLAPPPAAVPAAPAPAPVAQPEPAPAAPPEPAPVPAPVAKPRAAPAPEIVAQPKPAPAPAPAVVAQPKPAPAPAPAVVAQARPEPNRRVERAATPKPVVEQPASSRARNEQRTETRVAAATPLPEPRESAPRRTSPSFDCRLARSVTERLICADEDLARQDRELGGLHQRAKEAAADRRAFQRQSDAEWQRREDTCRDRECLQRWYAQRRADLSSAAAQAPAPRPAPAAVEANVRTERREERRVERPVQFEPVAPARTAPEPRYAGPPPDPRVSEAPPRPPLAIPITRTLPPSGRPLPAIVAPPLNGPAGGMGAGPGGYIPQAEGSPNAD